MARKNLLAGLVDPAGSERPAYPIRGASKSMIRSVGELARQANAYLEGEQVSEMDPGLIDDSFLPDRIDDESGNYEELRDAIRESGQNSPVLLRPHPSADGRYMVIFGHRRVRVARELGRKVRAVIKAVDDRTHILAQGQENAARADLSFIEKALFAKRLEDLSYERLLIGSALASNEAAVSKMISVTSRIPEHVVLRIGPARGVGRERWVELSLLASKKQAELEAVTADEAFEAMSSNQRFDYLMARLNKSGKPMRKAAPVPENRRWTPSDRSVTVTANPKGKTFSLDLADAEARPFGEWIVSKLDDLYDEYRKSDTEQ